jgi:hypothetical protein
LVNAQRTGKHLVIIAAALSKVSSPVSIPMPPPPAVR